MSIHQYLGGRNTASRSVIPPGIYLFLILVCLTLSSFALGYLAALGQSRPPVELHTSTKPRAAEYLSEVLASRSGEKYYYPWCSGLNRINRDNLVSFATAEEARTAGYERASNCAGP